MVKLVTVASASAIPAVTLFFVLYKLGALGGAVCQPKAFSPQSVGTFSMS